MEPNATRFVATGFFFLLIAGGFWAASEVLADIAIDMLDNTGAIRGGRSSNEWLYQLELWGIRIVGLALAYTIGREVLASWPPA